MTSFPRYLKDQTIRETHLRSLPEPFKRRHYGVGILNRKILMVEKHLDSQGYSLPSQVIYRLQNPHGFNQNDMGNPSSDGHEGFRSGGLLGVISRCEPDEKIGVNGAHDESSRTAVCLP